MGVAVPDNPSVMLLAESVRHAVPVRLVLAANHALLCSVGLVLSKDRIPIGVQQASVIAWRTLVMLAACLVLTPRNATVSLA